MKHRGEFCNYQAFEEIAEGFNAHVYGPKNENAGALDGGFMTYGEMQQKLRDGRVYIYTGTQPASYVLNLIEAMMTGIPVIALGPKHGNSLNPNSQLYEIPDIITTGVNGFVSDDIKEIRKWVQLLLNDLKLARRIGEMGRQRAIELFGREVIKLKWQEFLKV
jgi:glycosyltransferase involved in cell wall biosynthesis